MLGSSQPLAHAGRAMAMLTAIRDFFYEAAPVEVEKANGVPEMPPTPPSTPVGSSGLAVYSGHVTTAERSSDLTGANRQAKYAEWQRLIPAVGAATRAYLLLAGAPTWTVKPYKADDADEPLPEDVERAAAFKRQLMTMETDWQRHVMLGALAYLDGAAVGAWSAKVTAGTWALDDIVWLPLGTITRWDLDPQGKILGIVQEDRQTAGEIPIARERLIYLRDIPTTPHPAGDGALRYIAEAARQLLALEKLLHQGFERDVNGVPVIHVPIDEIKAMIGQPKPGGGVYTAADATAAMEPISGFIDAAKRKNAGIALDSTTFKDREGNPTPIRRYDAKVLSAAATSHDAIARRVNDLCWYILATLGFEYLAMGRDSGTQTMHVSKAENAIRVVSSALNSFASAAIRDLARPIWILNGWDKANPTDPQNLPTLEWDALELSDVAGIINAVAQALQAAGVEPGRADDVVDAVLGNLGLPRLKSIDDEQIVAQRQSAAESLRSTMTSKPVDPNEPSTITED